MRGTITAAAFALSGIASSLATVVLLILVDALTGMDVFGLFVWFIVPFGAIICGAFSASGYYLAAKRLHVPPGWVVLAEMVTIAAVTQLLIYYAKYRLALIDGVPASSLMTFAVFTDRLMTQSSYFFLARPMGELGYLVAAAQFVGMLIGGGWTFAVLNMQARCADCRTYLRKLAVKRDSFLDEEGFAAHYDHEFDHPLASREFAGHVAKRHRPTTRLRSGAYKLTTIVFGCPECARQTIAQDVSYWGAKGFARDASLARTIAVPLGMDMAPVYRGVIP
ncbi:hypothetical protein [Sphingomonas sp.]|uniref:hypothetical protein n=1 Tax=Sphingomonas sp. TaxID=28214 RepID=UPI001AFEB3C5|nr:hypothetical protein [Sphingomonas sp.]MBO9711783.1 hypothetical protein [Sphingomonas sp.]